MFDTFEKDLFSLSCLIMCVYRQRANLFSYNVCATNLYVILCASQTDTQDELVWLYLEKRNKFALQVSLCEDYSVWTTPKMNSCDYTWWKETSSHYECLCARTIVFEPHQYSITLASFGRFLHLLIMPRCCNIMQIFSTIALLALQT